MLSKFSSVLRKSSELTCEPNRKQKYDQLLWKTTTEENEDCSNDNRGGRISKPLSSLPNIDIDFSFDFDSEEPPKGSCLISTWKLGRKHNSRNKKIRESSSASSLPATLGLLMKTNEKTDNGYGNGDRKDHDEDQDQSNKNQNLIDSPTVFLSPLIKPQVQVKEWKNHRDDGSSNKDKENDAPEQQYSEERVSLFPLPNQIDVLDKIFMITHAIVHEHPPLHNRNPFCKNSNNCEYCVGPLSPFALPSKCEERKNYKVDDDSKMHSIDFESIKNGNYYDTKNHEDDTLSPKVEPKIGVVGNIEMESEIDNDFDMSKYNGKFKFRLSNSASCSSFDIIETEADEQNHVPVPNIESTSTSTYLSKLKSRNKNDNSDKRPAGSLSPLSVLIHTTRSILSRRRNKSKSGIPIIDSKQSTRKNGNGGTDGGSIWCNENQNQNLLHYPLHQLSFYKKSTRQTTLANKKSGGNSNKENIPVLGYFDDPSFPATLKLTNSGKVWLWDRPEDILVIKGDGRIVHPMMTKKKFAEGKDHLRNSLQLTCRRRKISTPETETRSFSGSTLSTFSTSTSNKSSKSYKSTFRSSLSKLYDRFFKQYREDEDQQGRSQFYGDNQRSRLLAQSKSREFTSYSKNWVTASLDRKVHKTPPNDKICFSGSGSDTDKESNRRCKTLAPNLSRRHGSNRRLFLSSYDILHSQEHRNTNK